jgi:hypothetical protein
VTQYSIFQHRTFPYQTCSSSLAFILDQWSGDGQRIEFNISLDGKNGLLRQAAERSGHSVGLPEDWLSELLPALWKDEGSGSGGFPVGMYPSWERPGLRVLAAPPQLILPMIFLASLQPEADLNWTDLKPALAMAAQAGIKTSERLRPLVRPYLGVSGSEESELDWAVEKRLRTSRAPFNTLATG